MNKSFWITIAIILGFCGLVVLGLLIGNDNENVVVTDEFSFQIVEEQYNKLHDEANNSQGNDYLEENIGEFDQKTEDMMREIEKESERLNESSLQFVDEQYNKLYDEANNSQGYDNPEDIIGEFDQKTKDMMREIDKFCEK